MIKLKDDSCSKETAFGCKDDALIQNGWVFHTVTQLSLGKHTDLGHYGTDKNSQCCKWEGKGGVTLSSATLLPEHGLRLIIPYTGNIAMDTSTH